jgi:hypothetical protein
MSMSIMRVPAAVAASRAMLPADSPWRTRYKRSGQICAWVTFGQLLNSQARKERQQATGSRLQAKHENVVKRKPAKDANHKNMDEEKPIDERWSRYPETVLHFPDDVMVDLRVAVEAPIKEGLRAMGLDRPFGVLTAYNPRGVDTGQGENDRRMKELEAELESAGDTFIRLDACSPDKSHCECSVALVAQRQRVIDIAVRWEQIAIFWWDGSHFWIYGGISDATPIQLPV